MIDLRVVQTIGLTIEAGILAIILLLGGFDLFSAWQSKRAADVRRSRRSPARKFQIEGAVRL